MADDIYTIKQGDQGETIEVALERYSPLDSGAGADGFIPVDVSDVTQAEILMSSGAHWQRGTGAILAADAPLPQRFSYEWDIDDLDFAGVYGAEVRLTRSDGSIETVPNGAGDEPYFTVKVVANREAA